MNNKHLFLSLSLYVREDHECCSTGVVGTVSDSIRSGLEEKVSKVHKLILFSLK